MPSYSEPQNLAVLIQNVVRKFSLYSSVQQCNLWRQKGEPQEEITFGARKRNSWSPTSPHPKHNIHYFALSLSTSKCKCLY